MKLTAQPITTPCAFAPIGNIIQLKGRQPTLINDGHTLCFNDLCQIDITGGPQISLYRVQPMQLPYRVHTMERHSNSRTFIPLTAHPYLVLATHKHNRPQAEDLRLFYTNGRQGVHFYNNAWHHTPIVIGATRDFIVVDSGSKNTPKIVDLIDEVWIPPAAGEELE